MRNSLVSHKQTHVSLTHFHTSGSVTMTFHHVGSYGLCLAVRSCLSVCHLSVNRCEITANTSLCHMSGYNLRFGAALSLQNTQSLMFLSLSSHESRYVVAFMASIVLTCYMFGPLTNRQAAHRRFKIRWHTLVQEACCFLRK